MFFTIFLGIMVIVFAWLTKLQGRKHPIRATVNIVMGALCLAWAGYRFGSGQHPISYPALLSSEQTEYLETFPPELFITVAIAGPITTILVWAVYDATNKPHL